jgi:hypothetical protein
MSLRLRPIQSQAPARTVPPSETELEVLSPIEAAVLRRKLKGKQP